MVKEGSVRVCFSIDKTGLESELGDWLLIAIRSIIKNTGWHPTILCPNDALDRLKIFRELGAEVRHARSRLAPAIATLSNQRNVPSWMEGALLRYEAPSLFNDEDYILYADCDTCFLREPHIDLQTIDIVGAATSMLSGERMSYNSGVIVFNVRNFRAIEIDFFDFVEATLGNWLPNSIDQEAFNEFFQGKISALNNRLNWLMSFGFNSEAEIVHFHSIRFQTAGWLLEGDFRGVQRDLFYSGYIHEYAKHVGGSIHTALLYLKSMPALIAGTSIARQFQDFLHRTESGNLLPALMASRAELGAARIHALAIASNMSVFAGGGVHSFAYRGGKHDVTGFLIYPCKDFGLGRITITFDGADNAETVQFLCSPAVAMNLSRPDNRTIACSWAGIGVDCHFVLTRGGSDMSADCFSIQCTGIGQVRIAVTAVLCEGTLVLAIGKEY